MPTMYDIARAIKLPGVKTTVTFSSEHLTPRVRNAVRRMIDSGIVRGSGTTAKLAKRLMNYGGISYVVVTKYGVTLEGHFEFSHDVETQLRELHEVYLLSDAFGKADDNYLRSQRVYLGSFLQRIREFVPIYSEEIAVRFAEVALQGRYKADADRTAALLAEFDCGATIPFNPI